MPAPALASMAKRAGKSMADAERYWNDAKKQVGTDNYALIMGIVKKRLGLKDSLQVARSVPELIEQVTHDQYVHSFFDSGILNFSDSHDVYIDPKTNEMVLDIVTVINENTWPHNHPVMNLVDGFSGQLSDLYNKLAGMIL